MPSAPFAPFRGPPEARRNAARLPVRARLLWLFLALFAQPFAAREAPKPPPAELARKISERGDLVDVEIYTIAFGGTLPILEWLAEDSGGTYRYIP